MTETRWKITHRVARSAGVKWRRSGHVETIFTDWRATREEARALAKQFAAEPETLWVAVTSPEGNEFVWSAKSGKWRNK